MKSADACVVRNSSSEPGKLQVTSPLASQSNSGPTASLSSAMNPSRETTAPMTVLPIYSSPSSWVVCDGTVARLEQHPPKGGSGGRETFLSLTDKVHASLCRG